jgi:hypothetical protein
VLEQLLDPPENVKLYSIVDIEYLAEDADWEVVDRFGATRMQWAILKKEWDTVRYT